MTGAVSRSGASEPEVPPPPSEGPILWDLLPDTSAVNADGHLSVGGVDLLQLAEEIGTPVFVYDEDHMRLRCREAVAGFGGGAAYATKAFLCKAMADLVIEEQMALDVSTGGEMAVAARRWGQRRPPCVPWQQQVRRGADDRSAYRRVSDRRRLVRRDRPAARPGGGGPRRWPSRPPSAPRHARHRSAHPRVREDRAGGHEVRFLTGLGGGARSDRRAQGIAGLRTRRRPRGT